MLTSRELRITVALVISFGIHAALATLHLNMKGGGAETTRKERRVTMTLTARRLPQAERVSGKILEAGEKTFSKAMETRHQKAAVSDHDPAREQMDPAMIAESARLTPVQVTVKELPEPLQIPAPQNVVLMKEPEAAETLNTEEEEHEAASGVDASAPAQASAQPVSEARPLYKENPPPRYPALARRLRYQGTVLLDVLVSADGLVTDLRLYRTSGHDALDEAALKAVKEWHFIAGRRGMQKIEMWVRIPVRFQLR